MVLITVELLRKRAEHNEGCLSTLEEIALHQQDIERITVVGDVCRQLQILYLCNNYIPVIEGLHHLKRLTYLNLAINNIRIIEGLEGCESLEKLDLTLNFIEELSGIARLRANIHLHSLHMTGNPCTNLAGYRGFVLHTLPQLRMLDGEDVVPSAAILAAQSHGDAIMEITSERQLAVERARIEQEMRDKGIDPNPIKYDEKGERLYGHTPEDRLALLREQEEREAKRKQEEAARQKESPFSVLDEYNKQMKYGSQLTPEQEIEKYGRILLRNEGKLNYTMDEERTRVIVDVDVGKFIATSSIVVDLQPSYVRITVKGKLLQLVFSKEVCTEKASVERSMTTGHLKLVVPYTPEIHARRE